MSIVSVQERIRVFERRQIVVSALGLVIFIAIAILANSLAMRSEAEQDTKFISRMVQIGDFREVGRTLEQAHLENFAVIHYNSARPGRSFVLPPEQEFISKQSIWEHFSREGVALGTLDPLASGPGDVILFEYNRFRLVPYALLCWLILNMVSFPQTRFMKRKLIEQFQRDLRVERELAKADVAKTVRHNFRTPLAALMRVPSRLPNSARSDRELLISIIAQIKFLISSLDGPDASESTRDNSEDLYDSLIQTAKEIGLSIPEEIRFVFDIDDAVASAIVPHSPHELRSILSNLVNNSVEAMSGSGRVILSAVDDGHEVRVTVQDSGAGISEEVAEKMFNKGFTHGKKAGSGIGLSHAKEWIESWGGRIYLDTSSSRGTKICVTLPIKDRAKWYVPRLKLSKRSQVVILDDQLISHDLWREKLAGEGLEKPPIFLSDAKEVVALIANISYPLESYVFLFDFDVGNGATGLELLRRLPDTGHRFLATGHFDQADIRSTCEHEGILMIPKSQINDLPIIVR